MDTDQPRRRPRDPARGTRLRRRRGLRRARAPAAPAAAPAAVAGLGAAAFGALDDLAGDSASKGLRGHLSALASGRVTTGAVKILGLGLTGAATAALADRRRPGDVPVLATVAGAAVVAAAANMANLLDLRPGRALKVTLLALRRAAGRAAACGRHPVGVRVRPDRRGGRRRRPGCAPGGPRRYLDARRHRRQQRRRAARPGPGRAHRPARPAGRADGRSRALTLASEKVSFTAVIEATPGLRELDALGRRPAR